MNSLPPPDQKPRRPLRPLHGIPEPETRGREGWFLSALLHAVIITALILPPFVARQLVDPEQQGAGGAGAAGGGGGGSRGSGGAITPERVRFLQMVPAPAAPAPVPPRAVPTPTPTPPPPPVEPEPEKAVQVAPEASPTAGPTVPTAGTGGGSGNDGSGGNGPGSGGGIGSGVGTGRGSGVGPGTGGGGDAIFPPTAYQFPILPLPVPRGVRPYRLVAQFEVDELGNARLLTFNPSSDRAYNRKIREMLAEVRFRPATRADGTAVRDTAYISAEAP